MSRRTEFSFLACFAAACGLLGWLLGSPLLGTTLGLCAYSIYSIVRMRKMLNWLQSEVIEQPPESSGEWGEILDELYRLRQHYLQQITDSENRVEHLQNSFTSLDGGVVLLNRSDEIDWCNQSASDLLGLRMPGDLGQPLLNLLRAPEFLEYFEEGDYDRSLTICSPLFDEIELDIQITWFGEGNRMLFISDVTEVRRLEDMRTEFIANVSHELRTPLTVITGYVETLLDTDTEWKAALRQMHDQAQRMETLLTDLTELSKLETLSEKDNQETVNVRDMIGQIFDSLSIRKPDQTLELRIKTGVNLRGNPDELYSAFTNLISNASKYTPDDGKIVVSWALEASGPSLAVSDNGIGIEEQHIPRLTERFYRADPARHRSTGGTGLGLAIVKHTLLRHQAWLDIDSKIGMGSTFSCRFPEERIIPAEQAD